jgi:hypothetical protein
VTAERQSCTLFNDAITNSDHVDHIVAQLTEHRSHTDVLVSISVQIHNSQGGISFTFN